MILSLLTVIVFHSPGLKARALNPSRLQLHRILTSLQRFRGFVYVVTVPRFPLIRLFPVHRRQIGHRWLMMQSPMPTLTLWITFHPLRRSSTLMTMLTTKSLWFPLLLPSLSCRQSSLTSRRTHRFWHLHHLLPKRTDIWHVYGILLDVCRIMSLRLLLKSTTFPPTVHIMQLLVTWLILPFMMNV